jgi:hypothetical protein
VLSCDTKPSHIQRRALQVFLPSCSYQAGSDEDIAGESLLPLAPPVGLEVVGDAPLQRDEEVGEKFHGGATRQWNLKQCVVSLDYWILWTSMYMGIGAGFTFLNNLGIHWTPSPLLPPICKLFQGSPAFLASHLSKLGSFQLWMVVGNLP